VSLDIIYYSNRSGNTKRFVGKLGYERSFHVSEIPVAIRDYILFVPTYGGGSEDYAVPKAVLTFLGIKTNVDLLRGIVGFGNTNFGIDYCKAAHIISDEFGVPILGKVELFGTPEDVERIQERLGKFNEQLQLS
jgi:protein involved in ribonucleotide reduction